MKQLKPLPHKPQLSDFFHPSSGQKKNDALLLFKVGTGPTTYALYNYLE